MKIFNLKFSGLDHSNDTTCLTTPEFSNKASLVKVTNISTILHANS